MADKYLNISIIAKRIANEFNLSNNYVILLSLITTFNGSTCNYKLQTLCNDMNVSKSTIQRYLTKLKQLKIIDIKRKRSYLSIKLIYEKLPSEMERKRQIEADNIIEALKNKWKK